MTIREDVLKVIRNSPRGLFPEDISKLTGFPAENIRAACFGLLDHGLVKVGRKIRPGGSRVQCLFYCNHAQVAGEELAPYEYHARGQRSVHKKKHAHHGEDEALLTFAVRENETTTLTITQARNLYRQLQQLFGKGA